jgi:hypothetical protein
MVFLGLASWWAILTGLVAGLRARLTPPIVRTLNVASAAIIGVFGIAAVVFGIAAVVFGIAAVTIGLVGWGGA